ncbi:zinc ribbon domain-containing protein [Dapis sp. BLCC M229]|uniref:zinc ribbon domain-containing protein n=1 Tax=Dapis sp. BLCC M229 TaxID=3400188 RepID=UPI003CF021FB
MGSKGKCEPNLEVTLVIRSLWELETLKSGFETEVKGSDTLIDCNFPSSKTCSNCGHVQDMPLYLRTYDCPECWLSIDRDLNASINLRDAVGESYAPPSANDRECLWMRNRRRPR